MDNIGAEVGQKMRSAIKAKLMELDCYVDDELPDYIMVMVANRRTKSQMNEDLNLFLSTKTSTFVNWLHIVLKKLKEVTVTNPEVYKKAIKRKSTDLSPPDNKNYLKVKKEKVKRESDKSEEVKQQESMTDELPILNKNRKIIVMDKTNDIADDNFDIPLLSEVNDTVNEQELQNLEKKIRNVKSRLGLLVESENEDESLNIKVEDDKFSEQVEDENNERNTMANARNISVSETDNIDEENLEKRPQHKRITFENSPEHVPVRSRLGRSRERVRDHSKDRTNNQEKKRSILDRLGKRPGSPEYRSRRRRSSSRDKSSRRLSERFNRRETSRERRQSRSRERSPLRSKMREGILGRLQSKITIVKKPESSKKIDNESENEEEEIVREVQSLIKVKPRVIPSKAQPNKTLLLKAMADAQRSIAQAPKVGKKYSRSPEVQDNTLSEKQNKIRQIIRQSFSKMRSGGSESSDEYNSDREYIPKPVRQTERDVPRYVPSSKNNSESESTENISKEITKQQFIITLDGIDKMNFLDKKLSTAESNNKKRSPSPIIFDKAVETVSEISKPSATRPDIPDRLPIVRPPLAIKNKERCRYWPGCRQGDKCEFVHPSENCKMFPQCKFGDKCLFLHPVCKFGSSCTKRDCPYDHNKTANSKLAPLSSSLQNCKFFPNCTNAHCPFYHAKPCKYGKFCKNITDCNFSHAFTKNLSWRSK